MLTRTSICSRARNAAETVERYKQQRARHTMRGGRYSAEARARQLYQYKGPSATPSVS